MCPQWENHLFIGNSDDLRNPCTNPPHPNPQKMKGFEMIQICYTKDCNTPHITQFDDDDQKPDEYPLSFYGYTYATEEEAKTMLDDEFVSIETKEELKKILC